MQPTATTTAPQDLAAYARLCGLRPDPAGAAGALALYCRMLAALSRAVGTGYRETQHTLSFTLDAGGLPPELKPAVQTLTGTDWHVAATAAGAELASGTFRLASEIRSLHRAIPARADLDSDLGLYGLALGDTACLVHRYADHDIDAYLALASDTNPWLTQAPEPSPHSSRLLPGSLLCGLLGTALEHHFADYRLRWLHQHVVFGVPAYGDDDLSVTITVTRLQRHNSQAEISGLIAGADGRYLLTCTIRVHLVPRDAA